MVLNIKVYVKLLEKQITLQNIFNIGQNVVNLKL